MLKVGGFTPLSTTDWPDKLAAVVFVQGCPWRCHYCHNPELQPRQEVQVPAGLVPDWPQVLRTLARRQGLLDGVVFSGGEPTLDPALPEAIATVRAMGLGVGLHTAGIYPDRLAEILPLIDWVGFDLKAPFGDYAAITAVAHSGQPAQRSFDAVLHARAQQGLSVEVRTTYHPRLHPHDTLVGMARELKAAGLDHWALQAFRPAHAAHTPWMADAAPVSPTLIEQIHAQGLKLTLR